MIPPIRKNKADDDDQEPQGHTGISGGPAGFKPRIPAIGAELDKDAQVWEVYVDETDRSDKELVKSWNDSLDVLLIFAALFSAITTALVIESSKRLQQDPTETSAQTLQAMSQILIAISNGQSANDFTSSTASPSRFSPPPSGVLVNALWYLSLTLSVAVSLVAMVSKSWCNAFMSNRFGPKYEQGRRRQEKWNAIEAWGMQNVFVYLPILMHLALLLFAIGLSIYLWDLCISVAVPVFFVTVAVASLYTTVTILPSVHQDCPYSTPLSKPLTRALLSAYWTASLCRLRRASRILPQTRQDSRDSTQLPVRQTTVKTESTPMDKVTSQMLLWLISNCEDSQLVDIALQSIAGARHGFPIEVLASADVTKMVAQRLNNCLVPDPETHIIRLKSGSSIKAAGLYAQALTRLLEWGAGFRSSSEHQVPQLDRAQTSAFFSPDTNQTIAELKELFFPRLGEDDNVTTIATSILAPLCHHSESGTIYGLWYLEGLHCYAEVIRLRNDRLIRSHLNGGVTIDSRALLALLEAAPHWIIHRMTAMDNEERSSSVMLLVQLLRSSSCSAPEFQYAIGLSLAVAAVLVHNYPGWQHPLNSVEDRTARALEVYRYYKVEYHVEPKVLVASGLLGLFGLFRGVSEATTTFGKDEVTIITDVLTQIGNLRSGFRLHTLPDTITIMQDAKMTLLETLQAVADGRSDFGEIAVIPCLTQFLNRRALLGSDIHKAALGAFLGAQNSRLRRICSPLLLRGLSRFEYYLTDLEPAQLSGLIDISLGDDAYSAPTAMMCLWKLTGWLIEDPDEQLATVLADMLKHDAFTSLRAKAPDLPASPRNMFEVGFAEMWYPLLKEMTSHKYAASIVNGSRIVQRMRDDTDSAAESAVPYLEELRDGRSWDDILRELFHTSSSDSEI